MKPLSDKDFEACLCHVKIREHPLASSSKMSSERLEFLQVPLLCCDMFTRVLLFVLCRLTSVQDTAQQIKHKALCEN